MKKALFYICLSILVIGYVINSAMLVYIKMTLLLPASHNWIPVLSKAVELIGALSMFTLWLLSRERHPNKKR